MSVQCNHCNPTANQRQGEWQRKKKYASQAFLNIDDKHQDNF